MSPSQTPVPNLKGEQQGSSQVGRDTIKHIDCNDSKSSKPQELLQNSALPSHVCHLQLHFSPPIIEVDFIMLWREMTQSYFAQKVNLILVEADSSALCSKRVRKPKSFVILGHICLSHSFYKLKWSINTPTYKTSYTDQGTPVYLIL